MRGTEQKRNELIDSLLRKIRAWLSKLNVKRTITLAVCTGLAALFVYGFLAGEKTHISTADVSPDGTKIAFASVSDERLWCYSEDGTLNFVHEFTSDETAGGGMCVVCSDSEVSVYTYRTNLRLTFDFSGKLLRHEKAGDDAPGSAEASSGWKYHTGGTYTITRAGNTYLYYRSYLMVRFFGKERHISVTYPNGETRTLWTAGGENDT